MASNVKSLPKSAKPPPAEEDDDPPDCPRCPPVGAPAWMATFADMATLLMAFFVLILAFANFDDVSFKKLAGSMRDSFGVQPIMPVDATPPGTVLEMDYRPSNTPPAETDSQDPPSGEQKEGNSSQDSGSPVDAAAKALTQAVRQAMQDGELTVETDEGQVTVKLPPGSGRQDAEALADAIAKAAGTQAQYGAETPDDQAGNGEGPGGDNSGASQADQQGYKAGLAEARLEVALREEIESGLVDIEQRDGKVFVTVGAGGAFPSGTDDLTPEAMEIISRLGSAASGKNARVTVTGHTDNRPIGGGEFRDNWDLAASRASAVVRAISETGTIDPANMTATSRGEADPVADNDTEEGREKNRRIEIEVSFDADPQP